jgi:hypothetical protein
MYFSPPSSLSFTGSLRGLGWFGGRLPHPSVSCLILTTYLNPDGSVRAEWPDRSVGADGATDLWSAGVTSLRYAVESLGDFNGDGIDDILTTAQSAGGALSPGLHFQVFTSRAEAFTTLFSGGPRLTSGHGVYALGGDVDGDTYDDYISYPGLIQHGGVARTTDISSVVSWPMPLP